MYQLNLIAGLDGADKHINEIGWLISYSNLLPSIRIFSVGKTRFRTTKKNVKSVNNPIWNGKKNLKF